MATETPPILIGRRYVLDHQLGAGSMGTVYQATDRLTGQTVALKRVHVPVTQLDFGSRTGSLDSLALTLAQEFKLLASLRHPNIISVLDYGFDDDQQPYVTMELLHHAMTVTQVAAQTHTDARIHLLMQMLQALVYLHRRGILHRDLKPRNVLVTVNDPAAADFHVKVLDFGLSIMRDHVEEGEVAGTPSYMAPELWYGKPASRGSDLYAVGVMAYEMFAGERPFPATDLRVLFKQVRDQPPDLSRLNADDRIIEIIARLLMKDADDRYPDAPTVLALLQEATPMQIPVETVATRESFLQAATFVGRDAEMLRLVDGLTETLAGQGGAWLVGGESGVGKSRLLDELRTRALVRGALVLRGQAVQEQNVPYAVWRDALRWLCLTSDLDERDASVLKSVVPDMDELLGRDIPDAPAMSAQADLTRLLLTIEALFRQQRQPVVVILEDLHWADSESLTVLARLSGLSATIPLMLVGSYRNDESPNLPMLLPNMSVIPLGRLSESGTADLVSAMLGPERVTPPLLDLLLRETEGNAFFLVEVLRALAEEAGELDHVSSGPLPATVFTGGVRGIVRRRLNRIPAEARPLLHVAAIAGRQLDLAVIREVLRDAPGADRLDVWLSYCSEAAVLDVEADRWRFAHNKLRDGVLDDLPRAARRELHRRVALAITSVYQYSSKQTAGALAYHWREAGDVEQEEQAAALAGEQAFRDGAYQTALGFLQRALELGAHVDQPDRRKAALLLQLGDTYMALDDPGRARTVYQDSLALCRAIRYQWGVATSLTSLGTAATARGETDDAAAYFIEALQTAAKIRAQAIMLSILTGMAQLIVQVGDRAVAVEYLALVLNHPAVDNQTHYQADKLRAMLINDLDRDVYNAAYEAGREASLRAVAERILAE